MSSLIYVYSIQITDDHQLITDVITLLRTTANQKKNSVLPSDGSLFLNLEFPPTRASFPIQRSQNLLEDQEKSGKFDIFCKKSWKNNGTKFLSMQLHCI